MVSKFVHPGLPGEPIPPFHPYFQGSDVVELPDVYVVISVSACFFAYAKIPSFRFGNSALPPLRARKWP